MTSPEKATNPDAGHDPMGNPAANGEMNPTAEATMPSSGENTGFGEHEPSSSDSSSADAAKNEGQQVAQKAKEGGTHVAGVAKDEATKVASTASEQAKNLLSQGKSELSEQAGTQKQRLTDGLMSVSAELDSMAENSEQSGPVTDLARQASRRTQNFAGWLEDNEPDAVVGEVKRFAQKRPGTFILVAAGVGLLAGRLTRGLTSDGPSESNDSGQDRSAGGDVYRSGGTSPAAETFTEEQAPGSPVQSQVGIGDEVDHPDTTAAASDDQFVAGRPTQDGLGRR